MKYLLITVAVFIAVLAWQWTRPRTSTAEARALVQNGALLLDVRTPQEFADGHVEGAVNVPVEQLAERLGEVGDKERPVVVYCRSGARSARATRILESSGFHQVVDIGPKPAW